MNNKTHLITVVLAVLTLITNSTKAQLVFNPGVDTTTVETQRAVNFYRKYLKSFEDAADIKSFWGSSSLKKGHFTLDPMAYAVTRDAPIYSIAPNKTILSISTAGDIVAVKTIFNWLDSEKITTLEITNHYIKVSKDSIRFIEPEEVLRGEWHERLIRNVNFHFPNNLQFNEKRADSLINSIVKLESQWNLKPARIDYYFSNTREQLMKVRGFDFLIGNPHGPSGMAFETENVVYAAGLGENYFHEVVHVYLAALKNKELQEGLAVFYGGSLGKPLRWHVDQLRLFVHDNPNLVFDVKTFKNLTIHGKSNAGATIEGMICNLIFQKEGIGGLKKIMAVSNVEEVMRMEFQGKSFDTLVKDLLLTFISK
jgi:hypothetical protein